MYSGGRCIFFIRKGGQGAKARPSVPSVNKLPVL